MMRSGDEWKRSKLALLSEKKHRRKMRRSTDEQKRREQSERKSLREGNGAEKSDNLRRGMQKKDGKEHPQAKKK